MKDCCGNGRANIVPKDLFSSVALKKVDSLRTNHQITNVTTRLERGEILEFNYVHFCNLISSEEAFVSHYDRF